MLKRNMISVAGCLLLFAASLFTGCSGGGGSSSGGSVDPNNNPGGTAPITTVSSTGNIQAVIGGVTINSPPVITFALSDENGKPLDPTAMLAASTSNRLRFFIARLDANNNYQNYIGTTAPSYEDVSKGGTLAAVDGKPGVYTFTFKTDIKDTTKTYQNLAFDATKTHMVGIQMLRKYVGSDGKTYDQVLNPIKTFRPDAGTITATREVVSTSACNQCHGKLAAHGTSRIDVALCQFCHTAGFVYNNVDLSLTNMIHTIHTGAKSKDTATMAGALSGFTTVNYPVFSTDAVANNQPMDCTKCHILGTDSNGRSYGKDANNYKTKATRANCNTCHIKTAYEGEATLTVNGVDTAAVAHSGGPQTSDANCTTCHKSTATSEYDISVPGAHTVWEKSTTANPGMVAKVISASNVGYGLAPVVRIQVTDAKGVGIAPGTTSTTMTVYAALKPKGKPDFINITPSSSTSTPPNVLSNGNPQTSQTATATSAVAVDAARGIYDVTFTTALPDQATLAAVNSDPTIFADGATILFNINAYRSDVTLTRASEATSKPQIKADVPITVYYDLATGLPSTDARRIVIDENKCKNCHNVLTAHSGRGNANSCVICHTPTRNDENYAFLIHKYHRGKDQAAGKFRRYTESSGIAYPNDIRRCDACHTSNNPEPVVSFPSFSDQGTSTTWTSNAFYTFLSPSTLGKRVPSMAGSCISCHDSDNAMSHAMSMAVVTSSYPYFGENCTSCHSSTARAAYHRITPR